MTLDSYLSLIKQLEREIAIESKRIKASVKEGEEARLLTAIPGVGQK